MAKLSPGWIITSGIFSSLAILVSLGAIFMHLKNYRRPVSKPIYVYG
jgi:hypothetical protein